MISSVVVLSIVLILPLLLNVNVYSIDATITLSPDQITEVEKNPQELIDKCVYRISLKDDPGKLCDAFAIYLKDKCEKLDFLPDYCGAVSIYNTKRPTQVACLTNRPLPGDMEGIKKCRDYISFDSTYSGYPLNFTVNHFIDYSYFDKFSNSTINEFKIGFSVSNPNAIPMKITDIYYDVVKGGEKVASDILPFSYNIQSASSQENIANPYLVPKHESSSINTTAPYVLNGTYLIDSTTGLVKKHFSFTMERMKQNQQGNISYQVVPN